MELKNIVYKKSEGVGTITLNRPGKLNAITFEMLDEMWQVLQDILMDNDIHVILLTGSGRDFCAGADLEIVGGMTPTEFRWRQRKYWNKGFPDSGGTVRLPWLIGLARAKELILTGDSITAKKAEELGLVNAIFPHETFEEEVKKIAARMAQKAPMAIGLGKQLINRSFQQRDIRISLEDVMDVQSILIYTEDYREAVKARKEKRPPIFRGK